MKNPFANFTGLMSMVHLTSLVRGQPADAAASRGTPARARSAAVGLPTLPGRPRPPAQPSIAPAPPGQADDDPDEEMRGGTRVAAARRRERARCAAIVMSPIGLKHPQVAYALAFQSSLTVAEAVATLEGLQTSDWAHLVTRRGAAVVSRYRIA